jgi:hypothetical protein
LGHEPPEILTVKFGGGKYNKIPGHIIARQERLETALPVTASRFGNRRAEPRLGTGRFGDLRYGARASGFVAQTSKSAVSRVSKPACLPPVRRARTCDALPIWKSALRQMRFIPLPEQYQAGNLEEVVESFDHVLN